MAFRKRKSITKGLHLNFSGSGVGIGYELFPGLSLSANSKGLYCNTSVPGTGFYSRNKVKTWVDGQNDKEEPGQSSSETEFLIRVNVDDEGIDSSNEVTVEVRYAEDNRLVSEDLYKFLKKKDSFKEALKNTFISIVQGYQDETDEVVDIYKLTAQPLSDSDVQKSLETLKPCVYAPSKFEVMEPNETTVKSQLEKEAQEQIKSVLFWTNNSKRAAYVTENLSKRFNEEHAKWELSKKAFEEIEATKASKENKKYEDLYAAQKAELQGVLAGDLDFVTTRIDALLESLQMPVEFSVSYEYIEEEGLLKVLLDLPEIENYPKKKGTILANGKLSVKNKTKFEQNEEYATSVTGLAFFFAGMFFNVSTKITKICVNGYTQRINGKTGNTEDQYVYSVLFDREKFSTLNYAKINPIEAISTFPCSFEYTKTGELKTIDNVEINKGQV